MQISTKALSVILISFLGGSQTAHAIPYEDAYGVTHYGFQCQDRFYTKPVIYAAAKNLCDKNSRQSNPRYPIYSKDGYRSPLGYDLLMDNEAAKLFETFYTFTPIFTDGTLFAFESDSPKKALGKIVRIDPGPDRLVIDSHCNVMGAFTDKDYKKDTVQARVKACSVLESKEGKNRFVQSSGRYPQRSREHSPERSQEILPERNLQLHPQRSREHSPERSQEILPERNLQLHPQRSREHSPERSQENTP